MLKVRLILTLLVTLVTGGATCNAAPGAQLHTTMSSKSFFVGEEFVYEILVSRAAKVVVDEIEGDDTLAIQFLKQEYVKDGDLSTVVLRYRMMPLRAGAVMIPSLSIQVGDQVLMTDEEVFIHVKQAAGYPGMSLVRELPDRDIYVGEPFRANYTWTSPMSLNGFRAVKLDLPLFHHQGFKIRSPHHWIAGDDKAAIGLPAANTRLIARYGNVTAGGLNLHTVSFTKIAIPVKPGEFPLSPATLLTSYVAPPDKGNSGSGWKTNYPSYFNNNFFATIEGETYEKYFAASKPRTLRVLPLPDAGRPRDFAGQVGKCRVTVAASPTVLGAGDPITLTIVIDGCEFPEVVELPVLGEQTAFSRQFAMPPRQSTGRIDGRKKTYIRTLRPLGQDVTVIPSVRIPYFDPETKTYGVAESAAIPITVKPAEMVTAFDAAMRGVGPLRNHIDKNPRGIRANVASVHAVDERVLSGHHWLVLLLVLPPLGFAIFYVATARQRLAMNDPVKARAMGAMKRFRRSVARMSRSGEQAPAQKLGQLDDAVRAYLADTLNLLRHAHTFEELEGVLGGRVDIEPLRQVYASAEYEKYRGTASHADVNALIRQAEQCIQSIHQVKS